MTDFGDEVDVLLVLGFVALTSLVLSIEVKEAAGEDKVATGIRRPAIFKPTKRNFKSRIIKFVKICNDLTRFSLEMISR